MVAYPCGVCNRAVAKNHMAIECDICKKWIHIKCNLLNKSDYTTFQSAEKEAEIFICINCISENIPFSKLNNNEFTVFIRKGIDNPSDCSIEFSPSDYEKNIFNKLNSAISNNAFDLDNEDNDEDGDVIPTINC